MKLILSSCDFRSEKAATVIRDYLEKPIAECKLLYFPNEKATAETIHSELYYARMQEFGFCRENTYVFDYDDPQQFTDLSPDVIYISGGNTFATLRRIRDCGFDQEIVRYVRSGVTYIGGSAGAHIATVDISHVSSFDTVPEGMDDFRGLGLFAGILVCHYTPAREAVYQKLQTESSYPVYALCDDDVLVVNAGEEPRMIRGI